jgi:Ger(x)C family germination protein
MNTNATELNNRAIVQAVGIDYSQDNYQLTIQFYNPQSQAQTKIVKANATTIQDAIEKINLTNSRELYFSHNSFIAVGMNATQKISDILTHFNTNSDTRPNVALVVTDHAEKLIEFTNNEDKVPAQSVSQIIDTAHKKGCATNPHLFQILRLRNSQSHAYPIAYVAVNNEQIVPNGTVIFKNDNVNLFLDKEKTFGYNLVAGKVKDTTLNLNNVPVNIKSSTCLVKPTLENNTATFTVDIQVTVKSNDQSQKSKIEDYLYHQAQTSISTIFLEGECDIYEFFSKLNTKHRISHEDWEKKTAKNTSISVNCQFE